MRIIEAVNDCTLKIGKTGENDATVVVFNLQDWLTLFGNNGTFQLMFKRPTDEHAYPVVIAATGGVVNWTVDETALAYSGVGLCEVVYLVNNTIAKSQTWVCEIEESPSDNSEEPPAPWQGWVDDVLQAATDAENAAENADAAADRAEEAAVHAPQIGENGNWEVWNQERGEYVDTGVPARSSSIHNDLEERNAEDAHPAASVSYFQGYEENEPDKKTNLDLALKYFSEGYGSEIVPLRTGWVRVACLMRAMNGRFGVSLTYNNWNKGRFTQNLMLEYSATARYAKKAYPSTGTPIENIGQPIVWQVSNVICGENPFCDRADEYKSRFNIIDAVRIVGISDESDTPNKMISFIDVHITNRGNTSDGFSLAEFGAQLKLNLAGKSWNNSVVPIYEYIDVSDINAPYTYVNNHETYREVMQEQARINVDFNHQVNLHPLVSAFIHQLTLGLAPTDDMDAATKKYVDDGLATKVGMDNHGNIPLVNLGNVPKVEVSYTDPQTGDDGTQMTIEAAVQLAAQTAHNLTNKVDKVSGKGLSTNDFTTALLNALNANTNARHTHANKSVLDGITAEKVSDWDNKQDKLVLRDAATASELRTALSTSDVATLTANIYFNAVLTIPAGKTVDLNGFNLYVKGLVNNGTLTKNEGRLWADVSDNNQNYTKPISTADVTNLWVANEMLLTPNTEFDGIRLIKNLSTAYTAGAKSVVEANLPRLFATGAGYLNPANNCYYFLGQIPQGKLLDLYNKNVVYCATTTSMGGGEIIDSSVGKNGRISLYMDDSAGRGTYANAVAVANERPTQRIFRIQQASGTRNYSSRAAIPVNATFIVSAGTANNVTFMVDDVAGFTRQGTADTKATNVGFKLANDITITPPLDLGAKRFDFNGHFVSGGKITTTGTVLHTNGGGYRGIYELIEEIITESDARTIERSADTYGNAFDLTSAVVQIVASTGGGGEDAECTFYGTDNNLGALVTLAEATLDNTKSVAMCEVKGNMLFASGGVAVGGATQMSVDYDSIMKVQSQSIKRIVIATSFAFPDGTSIKIYGAIR